MLKAIAIDDEPAALEVIRSLAAKIRFLDMHGFFTNAFEAAGFMQQHQTDLLFLDIKMPDISGIDFLQSMHTRPMVIFTTAYSEHAVKSFELNAIDYLLKPFSQLRFLQACKKAYEQHALRNSTRSASEEASVFLKSGYEQIRVQLSDILYVESNGNYVHFVLVNQKLLCRLTMSEVEALLPSPAFARIHRSFIVAKKQVSKIEKNNVWVNQISLPVGAGYLHEVEKIKHP